MKRNEYMLKKYRITIWIEDRGQSIGKLSSGNKG